VFARCGARTWLALVDAEPDQPGTAAPQGPDALAGLTETERRVAVLVAAGATNREIATRLFVSVKTVEAALTRIFRKLGVRSRVDVARLAARDR
ncbi:helix-turn-helix domain-containing protein, partial [Actinocorallia lasiicapitis]